jgi:hypothetical protein
VTAVRRGAGAFLDGFRKSPLLDSVVSWISPDSVTPQKSKNQDSSWRRRLLDDPIYSPRVTASINNRGGGRGAHFLLSDELTEMMGPIKSQSGISEMMRIDDHPTIIGMQ